MNRLKFIILFTISLIISFFVGIGNLSVVENIVQNIFLSSSGKITNDVVIVGIDNESISEIGRFPWDRSVYATLIDNLTEGDAAAIGFDIMWSEEQEVHDEILRDSIINAEGRVLLSTTAEFTGELNEKEELLAHFFYHPNETLLEANPRLGFINTLLDDNLVRRVVSYIYSIEEEKYYNSFNYELYKMYAEKNNIDIEELNKSYFARPFINYYGVGGSVETIPFHNVLDKEVIPPEYFENKIVLIGMTASGGEDIYYTPTGPMYGVEIHANFINNLLLNNYKEKVKGYQPVHLVDDIYIEVSIFLQMMFMSLLYIYMTLKIKSNVKKLITTIVISIIYVLFNYIIFVMGYMYYVAYPLMIFILLLLIDIIIDFFYNQVEKKRITDLFGRYMSKELVEKVVSEGAKNIKLGGIKKDVTVMFIDIRGFTSISEQLEPEFVMDILNEYLSMSTEKIFKYKGILDKYIGDGLMALFNVPYDIENPELMCVKAAFEIKENAELLHDKLYKKYNKSIRFGIGIHCGEAIIGNVGSENRMDYTAIGDTVNTSARLESNAKGGQILISEKIYDRIKDNVKVEIVGELKLKGKAESILTYEIIEVL